MGPGNYPVPIYIYICVWVIISFMYLYTYSNCVNMFLCTIHHPLQASHIQENILRQRPIHVWIYVPGSSNGDTPKHPQNIPNGGFWVAPFLVIHGNHVNVNTQTLAEKPKGASTRRAGATYPKCPKLRLLLVLHNCKLFQLAVLHVWKSQQFGQNI